MYHPFLIRLNRNAPGNVNTFSKPTLASKSGDKNKTDLFFESVLQSYWVRRIKLSSRYLWFNTQNTPFIKLRVSTQYGLIDALGSLDGGALSSSACETMDLKHHFIGVKDINI